jgi:hypothetical protein
MAQIKNFALGRLTGSFTMTPYSLGADGTLTPGTSRSLTGQMKTCRFKQSNDNESLVATPGRAKNEIILESGSEVEFGGLLYANDSPGSPTNWATNLVQNYDYFALSWVRGGMAITMLGIVRDFEENIEGKGGIPFTFSLGPVDANTANPVFS